MSLYNTLQKHRNKIGYGFVTLVATSILAGSIVCANSVVNQIPFSPVHRTPVPSLTSTSTPTATLEQMVEPSATPTLEPTMTATPTPVEYHTGTTRIEMLVARALYPEDIADNYEINQHTPFIRINSENEVCVQPALVKDDYLIRAFDVGCTDELGVLRLDIDNSVIEKEYGNNIQVAYDIGHMEGDKFVRGIILNGRNYQVVELSTLLSYQNGDRLGIEFASAPEIGYKWPVHDISLNGQQHEGDLIKGEARLGGYSDLVFVPVEDISMEQWNTIREELSKEPINSNILQRILLTDSDGDGIYNLLPWQRYDINANLSNDLWQLLRGWSTNEVGIVTIYGHNDYTPLRIADNEGRARTCAHVAETIYLMSDDEKGLTTYFQIRNPTLPIIQDTNEIGFEEDMYSLLVCGPKPKPTDEPGDRPTPTPGTIVIPYATPRDDPDPPGQ